MGAAPPSPWQLLQHKCHRRGFKVKYLDPLGEWVWLAAEGAAVVMQARREGDGAWCLPQDCMPGMAISPMSPMCPMSLMPSTALGMTKVLCFWQKSLFWPDLSFLLN